MKKEGISTFKVAATYIGTIVGAGFATGQEMLQFFTRFGIKGLYGLVLTTLLFIVFGYIIMVLGKHLNSSSHLEIIRYSGGKIIGTLMDALIVFFLFGALTAMIAVSQTLGEESGLITNWAVAAILYISYNTVLSVAVLGPLGVKARDKKAILYGSILGGLGLGVGSIMIYFAMFGNIEQAALLGV